jgi:hypothetical protein
MSRKWNGSNVFGVVSAEYHRLGVHRCAPVSPFLPTVPVSGYYGIKVEPSGCRPPEIAIDIDHNVGCVGRKEVHGRAGQVRLFECGDSPEEFLEDPHRRPTIGDSDAGGISEPATCARLKKKVKY